ncbi:MAG: FlgO family outer membrane protein, partial [candidate division NC10 bacterium]
AIDARTTHELGRILGVAAVVTGTLNDLPDGLTEVNARVIETQTGKVLSAGKAEIERTWRDAHDMSFGGPAPRTRLPRYRTLPAAELLPDSNVEAEKLLQSAQDAEQSPNSQPQDIAAAWCGLAQYQPKDRLNVKAVEACERWREYAEYWQNMRDRFYIDYEKLSDYLRLKRKTSAQKTAAIEAFAAAYGEATKDWPTFFRTSLDSLAAKRERLSRLRDLVLIPGGAFYLERQKVDVGRFDEFCRETGRSMPKRPPGSRAGHPMVNVARDEASAYCEWSGGRLPTDAEWATAAKGGTKNPNQYGLLDMPGNAREWTADAGADAGGADIGFRCALSETAQ